MTNYDKMWNKDSAKETAEHVKSRLENYTELVNGGFGNAIGDSSYIKVTTTVLPSCTSTDGVSARRDH